MSAAGGWVEMGPRSLLFVPADRCLDLLPKALKSGADGVIVDLEDAVAPSEKAAARRQCATALAGIEGIVPVFVRVNAVGTEWFSADVESLAGTRAAGVVLSKCQGPDDVGAVATLLPGQPLRVIPMVETARGVQAAAAIADASPVVGIAFGAEDLAAQMGVVRSRSGRELLYARSHAVLGAVAAGKWAIDSPCMEPRGASAVRREAGFARRLGFVGKLVIHPAQVSPVHAAFAANEAELAEAHRVVDAYEALSRMGSGVGMLDGRMIDEPIVRAARRILDRESAEQRGGHRN